MLPRLPQVVLQPYDDSIAGPLWGTMTALDVLKGFVRRYAHRWPGGRAEGVVLLSPPNIKDMETGRTKGRRAMSEWRERIGGEGGCWDVVNAEGALRGENIVSEAGSS